MLGLSLPDVIQLTAIGLAQGCLYSLIAIGLVLVYKATEQVNFAQGELMMLGAFFGFQFVVLMGLPVWLGFGLALIATALVGFLFEAILIRPLTGQPAFTVFILTLAVGIVLRAIAGMVWGYGNYSLPEIVKGTIEIGPAVMDLAQLFTIAAAVLAAGALYIFFRYGRVGIAMQALSLNQLAAFYMGIPVKTLTASIWAIAAGFGALSGLLLGSSALVSTGMGFIGFKAFAGAIVGGFGSIAGAVFGCILVGLAEPFFDIAFPTLKGIGAYVIMFAVLIARPEGLIPQIHSKKV